MDSNLGIKYIDTTSGTELSTNFSEAMMYFHQMIKKNSTKNL